MGANRKYEDSAVEEKILDLPEHPVSGPLFNARKYDPSSGHTSLMAEVASGDWSWKPHRNTQFSQGCMPRFFGVPPGAAEIVARARGFR